MQKFELIEHTADIGVKAHGSNLAEAFANAAYGMFSILTDMDQVRETEAREVEVNETDPESLLFEWLNHFIYLFDLEGLIFKRFEILEFSLNHLKAKCYGEKYDPARHEIKLGIKSATYHKLMVDPDKNQVQVIFDV